MASPHSATRHRITVLGTGYLGTAHAACLADLGFEVLGVDVSPARIEALTRGELPFYEPGLEPLLQAGLASGRLSFSTSYAAAAAFGDVHFVCVGTPQREGAYAADLSQLTACIDALGPAAGPALPGGRQIDGPGRDGGDAGRAAGGPGAGRGHVRARVESGVPARGARRPGHAAARPDRRGGAVRPRRSRPAGGVRGPDRGRRRRSWPPTWPPRSWSRWPRTPSWPRRSPSSTPWRRCARPRTPTSSTLSEALGHDPRIGRAALRPGLGFGGGCLPKDIRAFMARAEELGVEPAVSFLREVDGINMRRRARMVDLARELAGGSFEGRTVGVLGVAFKPDSDDIRDSPALDVAATIHGLGASVSVYDPAAMSHARRAHPELTLRRLGDRGRHRRRRDPAADRVAGVPRRRPGKTRRGGGPAQHRGRPECARRRPLARRRLALPGPGPAVT